MKYSEIYNDFIAYCQMNEQLSKRELVDRFMMARCLTSINIRDMLNTAINANRLNRKGV